MQRPLELGATAAGADQAVLDVLSRYGQAVGEAFALRDDILGVWGDPTLTGKPAGDDLITGKPTVLLAIAAERTSQRHARSALDRAGTPAFSGADLHILLGELSANGTRALVEQMISDAVACALDAVHTGRLDPDATGQLSSLAHTVAWRQS